MSKVGQDKKHRRLSLSAEYHTIDDVETNADYWHKKSHKEIKKISIKFGPHHYLNITNDHRGILFNVGTTHHGFTADASNVDSELEKIINKVRELFPNLKQD